MPNEYIKWKNHHIRSFPFQKAIKIRKQTLFFLSTVNSSNLISKNNNIIKVISEKEKKLSTSVLDYGMRKRSTFN